MRLETASCDISIVGYGPVSAVLAIMLGQRGFKVTIYERWTERYSLPRAVCLDHEMYRMLSAIGMGEELPSVSHPATAYRWFNAEWNELLSIDWGAPSISGGPEVNFIHQPTLEAMFDRHVRALPNVQVNLGWEAVEVSQSADCATLRVVNRTTGEHRQIQSRYLIGCDGANSTVRKALGTVQTDRGFEADWLVIDILPHEGVELDIPSAAQWCNPARPTTIVPAGISQGRYYRRWEFMRLPHETVGDIENEAFAWQLLEQWVRPEQATMVRHKVYTFRSLLADKWRDGRLLIAGDAAHVMPPFMGQGMCAGLRDNWNLAWKLAMVLEGRAPERLLDTYQSERLPHVSDVIDLSMYLGQLICQPDEDKATARDLAFLTGSAPQPPPFPSLTQGIILKNAAGARGPAAGLLGPHVELERQGKRGRLDALLEGGFKLFVRELAMLDNRSPVATATIKRLQLATYALSGEQDNPCAVADLDGRIVEFMDEHGLAAMIVRPDFYIFGGAREDRDIDNLINALGFAVPAARDEGTSDPRNVPAE
ncbi:bifunctional 3-(3-hydroxy-phenyl)propionate/3-hydroxycinnamic acid hydroxylase (plasmid) [Novosphingobium sp. BL-8A]|uniref:bifunctional 3-(3-hydroxy-phenyl)propionate/3-hydroxycinnamic acid hydroxylase MhpA n=1 Tax=Novosphingobium sp. BL-8A TaxID=3127639 RepID=UPI0037572696